MVRDSLFLRQHLADAVAAEVEPSLSFEAELALPLVAYRLDEVVTGSRDGIVGAWRIALSPEGVERLAGSIFVAHICLCFGLDEVSLGGTEAELVRDVDMVERGGRVVGIEIILWVRGLLGEIRGYDGCLGITVEVAVGPDVLALAQVIVTVEPVDFVGDGEAFDIVHRVAGHGVSSHGEDELRRGGVEDAGFLVERVEVLQGRMLVDDLLSIARRHLPVLHIEIDAALEEVDGDGVSTVLAGLGAIGREFLVSDVEVGEYEVIDFLYGIALERLVLNVLRGLDWHGEVGGCRGRVVGLAVEVGKEEIIVGTQEVSFTVDFYLAQLSGVIVLLELGDTVDDVVGHVDEFVHLCPVSVLGVIAGVAVVLSGTSLPGEIAEDAFLAVILH